MPAIHLETLKKQISAVAEQFNHPDVFARGLTDLFEFYANRVHRQGQTGEPESILEHYNLPKPMLRQMYLSLGSLPSKFPEDAISLCDTLWRQTYYEHQVLAAFLVGRLPLDRLDDFLSLIEKNVVACKDQTLLKTIADFSTYNFRKEDPQRLLDKCEDWLDHASINLNRFSLLVLGHLAGEDGFENLPGIYTLISPATRKIDNRLSLEILQVVNSLAKRSPAETAYFLKKNWQVFHRSDTAWLIRQSLPNYSPELRKILRDAIRTSEKSS
jgi:hypothetical protein